MGAHEAETKGNSVDSSGKCKVSRKNFSRTLKYDFFYQAKCTASPTCASWTWHKSTLRLELNKDGVLVWKGENHICRLFTEDPTLYVEKPSVWKFGPRTCLSNFNPGKA